MKLSSAVPGGFAGAIALTLLHESLRRLNSNAARMDLLGMEAVRKSLEAFNFEVPEKSSLFKITMAGDIVSNTIYYSLANLGDEKKVIARGALAGLAAGLGAVYLPKQLGLNQNRSSRTYETKMMTVALYLFGSLVASVTSRLLETK